MNDSDYERLKKELHEFMADLQSDVHYLGKAFLIKLLTGSYSTCGFWGQLPLDYP